MLRSAEAAAEKDVAAIVAAVQRSEAASVEQTAGIDQINKAVAQLDSGTRQNTAMMKERLKACKTREKV